MVDGVFTIRLFADPQLGSAAPGADGRAPDESTDIGLTEAALIEAAAKSPLTNGKSPNGAIEFLAGPENRLAAIAVASLLDERPSRYNPLVLYGPSGTGKTHLARGLAQRWHGAEQMLEGEPVSVRQNSRRRGNKISDNKAADSKAPANKSAPGKSARTVAYESSSIGNGASDSSVVYATASEFSQWLNSAIDSDTTAAFRRRVRGAALLVVEDLTQFASRRVAQQELIHTLDAILDHQGQVIFTSRTVPAKIPGLSPALSSRLAGGLAVPLVPPAAAARLACIQRIAELRGVALPAAGARLLANGLSVTVPELFGAVTDLHLQSQVDGLPIDAARVRRWLAERQLRLRPSLRTITRLSAKYFGLRVAELISPSRQRNVVQARAVAMYLARQLTGKSLEQVGTHFGGRDHTTVLHNCRSIEGRVRGDPNTRRAVADIRKLLAHV